MISEKLSQYKSAKKVITGTIVLQFLTIGLIILLPILLVALAAGAANSAGAFGTATLSRYDGYPGSGAGDAVAGLGLVIRAYLGLFIFLFFAIGVLGILLLVFYIMSIAKAYEGQTHDILLIIGLFIGIIGLVGLFIKLGYVNRRIAELQAQQQGMQQF